MLNDSTASPYPHYSASHFTRVAESRKGSDKLRIVS
jgi:hypothetical protein